MSSQDHSGALHASIQSIYYLIWVREGGLACPWMSYSGWTYPMEKWIDYQMKNPTEIHNEGPGGRFFGQLANGKITKWQEDGAFYVIWNAFTHWTQTGSEKYVSNDNLDLLKESVQWLEKYCFDNERGLFYRYYYCETPLYNSRDYGWDNAVGKPVLGWDPDLFQGQKLEKSYDIYINMLNFSVYKMLEAMCNAQGLPNNYGAKAAGLAEKMKFMFVGNDLPLYGEVISTEGKTLTAKKYEIDRTDYIWALTCPPFYPPYLDMDKYRNKLFNDLVNSPDYYFLAGYFSILGSLNLAGIDQQEVRKAIDYAAKECYILWVNLPMAGSMVEMSGYYPPGSAHQIRPQMFTMGAWFGAMGNLGVKPLPYGLTVQPAQLITGIKSYAYNDKILDFSFEGEGNTVLYSVNGTAIKGSLQIPEQKLANGNNKIEVKVSNVVDELPLLLNSTMKLNSIDHSNEKTSYHFESLNAENSLTISLTGNPSKIQLKNTKGKSIKINTKPLNTNTYQVDFSYKGSLVLEVRK